MELVPSEIVGFNYPCFLIIEDTDSRYIEISDEILLSNLKVGMPLRVVSSWQKCEIASINDNIIETDRRVSSAKSDILLKGEVVIVEVNL